MIFGSGQSVVGVARVGESCAFKVTGIGDLHPTQKDGAGLVTGPEECTVRRTERYCCANSFPLGGIATRASGTRFRTGGMVRK